jgi:hypothetical protein
MLRIREINDLNKAALLWRALSPNQTIFDLWDWRFCFYKYEPMEICFLAAYDTNSGEENSAENLVGLMPLEKHPKHGWEFFAEDPSEESRPFVRAGYEKIIPDLYAAIPAPAKCYDITGDDEFTKKLPLEDYKYILPLENLYNFEDYLKSRLSAKKQRNFRADFRKIEDLKPEIIFDDLADIEAVFKLNSNHFSDSYLKSETERAAWRDLLTLPYNWRLVSIKINNYVVAASLAVVYNGIYFYLINGADISIPNLGKYLNKINLERALALKAKCWDAGLGDCNWKKDWHLDKIPQYLFKKD